MIVLQIDLLSLTNAKIVVFSQRIEICVYLKIDLKNVISIMST